MSSSPISCKFSGYNQNGTGRDAYIFNNNGGMHRTIQRDISVSPHYEVGSMTLPQRNYSIAAQTSNKIIRYVCNGTGRDTYIQTGNNGGASRYNLRKYEFNKPVSQSDIFTRVQFQKTPREKMVQSSLKFFQSETSNKLSIPKRIKQKYVSNKFTLPPIKTGLSKNNMGTQSQPSLQDLQSFKNLNLDESIVE